MNRNKRIVSTSTAVETIPGGLARLAQAFRQRNVAIAKISLKRGRELYEYAVNETTSDTQFVQAQFRSIVITVSCIPPLNSESREILQSRTQYAAIAAVDWIALPAQLTLLQNKTLDTENSNATSHQIEHVEPAESTRMIGTSTQIIELIHNARRAANSNHVVLILGESGTGKTTAASMIHERSPRAGKPFVDVNCASIPDSLVESELFGHEKGAFTGAIARKKGLFEMADGGTLFLDEIGELKLELQAKLLTAIEQQRFRRLGGNTDIKCDVRILVASSRNLQRMVLEGKFREDLYYRLAVLEISIPPLRDRREDIPILVQDRLIQEQQRSGVVDTVKIEDAALRELSTYHWPGNIRELHNVIARLSICADKGSPITAESVRKEIERFNRTSNQSRTRNDESDALTRRIAPAIHRACKT